MVHPCPFPVKREGGRGRKGAVFQNLCPIWVSVWTSYRVLSTAFCCFLPQLWLQALPFFTCIWLGLCKHEGYWQPLWGDGDSLCPGGFVPRKGQSAAVPPTQQPAGSGLSAGEGDDGDGARTVLEAGRGWKPPQEPPGGGERRVGERTRPERARGSQIGRAHV